MSDEKIIDFNNLKNKVKDSDVDKFENYIYSLYFSVMEGKISMMEFSRKIIDYMKDNNISNEKFMNIQKKFMERYGMDTNEIEEQLKKFGVDITDLSRNLDDISDEDLSHIRKSVEFIKKYQNKLTGKMFSTLSIKNNTNDVNILIDNDKILIHSKKKVNLMDSELNEFLLCYKNSYKGSIKITICENSNEYEYKKRPYGLFYIWINSNLLTSNNPLSVIFISGITGSAKNAKVIKGSISLFTPSLL